jgi:hypothetical protein
MNEPSTLIVTRITPELTGHRCWSAKRGHGTFLTFEIGERLVEDTKRGPREVGAYHLWIYLAQWKIVAGHNSADWDSSNEEIDQLLQQFEGASITAIDVSPLVFRFSGRIELSVSLFPQNDASPEDPMFHLFLPNRRVLSALSNGSFTLGGDRVR